MSRFPSAARNAPSGRVESLGSVIATLPTPIYDPPHTTAKTEAAVVHSQAEAARKEGERAAKAQRDARAATVKAEKAVAALAVLERRFAVASRDADEAKTALEFLLKENEMFVTAI